MKEAKWTHITEKKNSFNSIISDSKNKGFIQGTLDTIAPSNSMKASKYVDTSTFIFITTAIVGIKKNDLLEIDGISYKVNYVDNPMFMNHHLEIELEIDN